MLFFFLSDFVSKFAFFHPPPVQSNQCPAKGAVQDADGDIVVKRRKRDFVEIGNIFYLLFVLCFYIVFFFSCSFSSSAEHHNSTDLTLVGLQVWRGALLLADYILHNQQQFIGKNVVELGSGVGLTGVAAAMYAKHVTCTGKSEDFRENKSFSLLFIFPIVRY